MGERKKGDETEAKIGERREPEQAAQAIINLACNATMAHNLFVQPMQFNGKCIVSIYRLLTL